VEDVRYRPARPEDLPFLATMLGEAAVWRPDKHTPTAGEVMADPRYVMYLAGWPRPGDFGLVAEAEGPLGAAWYRTYTETDHGYGFVAEDVPELSIAVIASRRHQGIGRRLLIGLVQASEDQGHAALSLSVNHDNPAKRLYESVGFRPVGEPRASGVTMIRHAVRRARGSDRSRSLDAKFC
jgi:ribosomal protein S18 acetylase RimI-like enzyme